ncbi:MAG: NADH:ubiquinone reductase (Na(+)-transporting) subunit C [Marinilabiliales bacterium]|nr:MAG: NADH:ubiquinone reductase (Na(+)-transporting) subunit C [Marinilabiliales bacterium]
MYSNGYIFRYAAIMVIVAAALLSTAAMFLKPFQEKNRAIEKMGSILISADIKDVETEQTISTFNQYVVEALIVDSEGTIVDSYTEGVMQESKAFEIDLKKELYKKSKSEKFALPLYVVEKEGVKTYVIPMRGSGLWGPVYGNMALAEDLNTIVGVTFDHDGETPGLGAEITTPMFTKQFIGKKIFDEQGNFTSIKVVKGGAKTLPQPEQIHAVDAISGGTITSNGVGDMIQNVIESYEPYFKKQK